MSVTVPMQNLVNAATLGGGGGEDDAKDLRICELEAEKIDLEAKNKTVTTERDNAIAAKDEAEQAKMQALAGKAAAVNAGVLALNAAVADKEQTIADLRAKMTVLREQCATKSGRSKHRLTCRSVKKQEPRGVMQRKIIKLCKAEKENKKIIADVETELIEEKYNHSITSYNLRVMDELAETNKATLMVVMKGKEDFVHTAVYAMGRAEWLEDLALPGKGVYAHISHAVAEHFLPATNPVVQPKGRFSALERKYQKALAEALAGGAVAVTEEEKAAVVVQHLMATA